MLPFMKTRPESISETITKSPLSQDETTTITGQIAAFFGLNNDEARAFELITRHEPEFCKLGIVGMLEPTIDQVALRCVQGTPHEKEAALKLLTSLPKLLPACTPWHNLSRANARSYSQIAY